MELSWNIRTIHGNKVKPIFVESHELNVESVYAVLKALNPAGRIW